MTPISSMPAAAQGVITIITLLLGTVVAWYALSVVRWEIFIKNVDSPTSRLLRMLLAIMIGTGISSFILQYIAGAAMIRG